MRRRVIVLALVVMLIAPGIRARRPVMAHKSTPDSGAVGALVWADDPDTARGVGVYLGHGLVLTTWHVWTLDGDGVTDADPALSPARTVPEYDDDGVTDPGEDMLGLAWCDTTWRSLDEAGPDCVPYTRLDGAGLRFPLDGADDPPVPVESLVYASRAFDIALVTVDAAAVEARGVRPARLSAVPLTPGATVLAVHPAFDSAQQVDPAALESALPVRLPVNDAPELSSVWRVPSLVMALPDAAHTAVFDPASGAVIGLAWRASEDGAQTWVTPALLWLHALYAAQDAIQSPALAAVLADALTAPVDGAPTLDDPLAPGLGNGGIDVVHYTLDLAIDPAAGLTGSVTLDVRATRHGLFTFSLDAVDLAVSQVTVDGAPAGFAAKSHKLYIQLPEPVDYGARFQVRIEYTADPQPFRSAYMPFFDIGYLTRGEQVFTLNQPDGSRTWFPCNDHPRDRATYDFFLRVNKPLDAVANGELVETALNGDGSRTFHWRMADPMATYLVVVAVGDYVPVETAAGDVLIRQWVYPDAVEAAGDVFGYSGAALALLADLFGPYPYASYGHVVVPGAGMALETQTMTLMPDNLLTQTEGDVFTLLVHELAHQWYGNTVTLGGWGDIWLNEGFATYAEWLALDARFGPDAALAARSASEQALLRDGRTTPLAAPDPAELFGIASYDKGAWVLHMLRREIGDEPFFALLRTYAQTYADRPTDSLAVWRLAEAVSGRDLAPFFEQWLLQGGIPRYTFYWSGQDAAIDVRLCPLDGGAYRLALPLRVQVGADAVDVALRVEESEAAARFELPGPATDVIADPDQAVLAQVQVQPIAALPEVCPAVSVENE